MKKRTIFEALREYLKKKPVTQEEIEQLKLEAQKYRLQADIAKSKAIINKSKGNSSSALKDLFGPSSQSSRSKHPKDTDDGGLRDMMGNNDSSKYEGLFSEKNSDDVQDDSEEKKNFRKRTLGY